MDKNSFWFTAFQMTKFLLLCLFIVYLYLLPVDFVPGRFHPPNFVLILTIAMVIRVPHYMTIWLVFTVFLLQDFLLYNPLGLSSFLGILLVIYLNSMRISLQGMTFVTEWIFVGVILTIFAVAREILLILIFADRDPIWDRLAELLVTFGYYPVAVLFIAILYQTQNLKSAKTG